MYKVDVIIPCHNEGPRVGAVLKALLSSPHVNKIIVVDDGSNDNSSEVAKTFSKTEVITLKKNIGKGGAVRKTLDKIETEAVFLCDADIRGFQKEHLEILLEAYRKNPKGLVIGIRMGKKHNKLMYWLRENLIFAIDGERIMSKSDLKAILRSKNADGYGLEAWTNYYFRKNKKQTRIVVLDGVWDGPWSRKEIRAWANEAKEISGTYKEVYKDSLKRYGEKIRKASLVPLEA